MPGSASQAARAVGDKFPGRSFYLAAQHMFSVCGEWVYQANTGSNADNYPLPF